MARLHGRTSTIHDGVQRIGWQCWHVSFTIYNAHKYKKQTNNVCSISTRMTFRKMKKYSLLHCRFSFFILRFSFFFKKIWLELDMWEMRAASPSCRVTKVNSNIDSRKSNVGHQTEGVTLCIIILLTVSHRQLFLSTGVVATNSIVSQHSDPSSFVIKRQSIASISNNSTVSHGYFLRFCFSPRPFYDF